MATPEPIDVRVTSLREVGSPHCANHVAPTPNAKLPALIVCGAAAVGMALQAEFTAFLTC